MFRPPSIYNIEMYLTPFEYRQFYRRNRPHIHPPDSTLFITFRLAGSIAKAVIDKYRFERKLRDDKLASARSDDQIADADVAMLEFHRNWFRRFDEILDRGDRGPMWLGEPRIREIIYKKLVEDDGPKYRLDAFCLMSNHVHIVFKPNLSERNLVEKRRGGRPLFVSEQDTLAQIMQSLKGGTARQCNLILGRSGSFWETESFDHVIRDDTGFARAVKYTLNNPVKAGLVTNWRKWPGTYVAPRLLEREWMP